MSRPGLHFFHRGQRKLTFFVALFLNDEKNPVDPLVILDGGQSLIRFGGPDYVGGRRQLPIRSDFLVRHVRMKIFDVSHGIRRENMIETGHVQAGLALDAISLSGGDLAQFRDRFFTAGGGLDYVIGGSTSRCLPAPPPGASAKRPRSSWFGFALAARAELLTAWMVRKFGVLVSLEKRCSAE